MKLRRVALCLSLILLVNLVFVSTAWAQLPGPLEDMLREAQAALYGSIQDALRVILAIPLWLILRLCLYVGTLGTAFPEYFGSLITQTLDHIVSSNIRDILQQSAYVALSLAGLSMLLKPLWPEFRPARFQRIVLWGALIGFFLTQASSCYSTAEDTRVETANSIASTLSGGLDSVDLVLSMIGATRDEVQTADIAALPNTVVPPNVPFTIEELFHRCPYDPANRLDTDPDCDLDHASDPFEPHRAMTFNTGGLIVLILGLFPSLLVLAQGLAFLGLGLSAGMLFIAFPFTAILAFYTPLEGIPAAVIKGYVTIFIKTIILSVVSAMVLNVLQFDFGTGSPSAIAMAGIGLVGIFVMAMLAKEGLSSVFTTFSLIANSVSNVGQNLGVAVGGAAQPFSGQPSTEAMMAAAALTGGNPIAMAALGGASPYMMMGLMGGSRGHRSQADGYSPGQAIRTALTAGREVVTKVGGAALTAASGGAAAVVATAVDVAATGIRVAEQARALRGNGGNRTTLPRPAEAFSSSKPHNPLLDRYTQEGREQMLAARQKLHQMGPEAEGAGLHIVTASQVMAADWRRQNRHVQDKDGHLNPEFADSVARSLDRGQLQSFTAAQRDLPPAQRVGLNEAIALGAAEPVEVPQREIRETFAEAVRTMGKDENLDEAMQRVSDGTLSAGAAFGDQRRAAEQLVQDFQDRGISGDRGAQLIKAVHDDLAKNPDLTVEQFRQSHPVQMEDPVGGWDSMTGGAEHTDRAVAAIISTAKAGDVTVASVPTVKDRAPGAAKPVEVSQQEARETFVEAVRTMGKDESLDGAMQRVSNGTLSAGAAFGDQRQAAEQLVRDFQDRGISGDRGAQLIEAVHDDLARNPDLTVEQFRQSHPAQMEDSVGGWDLMTGGAKHTDRAVAAIISASKAGDVTVAGVPKVKERAMPGAAKPVEVSQREARDTFVEAVRTMGKDESLDGAMQRVSNGTLSAGAAFGDQRQAAERLVQDFRDRGITGDRGAQLIKAVHDDLARTPDLTAEQFRQNHPAQMEDSVGGWDRLTGGAEHTDRAVAAIINTANTGNVTIASVPRVEAREAPPPKADATPARSTGPGAAGAPRVGKTPPPKAGSADAPTPTPPPSGRSGRKAKVKADATSALSTQPKEEGEAK